MASSVVNEVLSKLFLFTLCVSGSSIAAYIKVDAGGEPLPETATAWACVYDDANQLLWEVKRDDGGVQDSKRAFRWGAAAAEGGYGEWDTLVEECNRGRLCGLGGWEVPTKEQLSTILLPGEITPAINTNYFPNTIPAAYWSSSKNRGSSYNAWNLYFDYGGDGYGYKGNKRYVRLVRAGVLPAIAETTAAIAISTSSDAAPLVLKLDGSGSIGADGTSQSITSYQWWSSDGQEATGSVASLKYEFSGEYTITLTVTDKDGFSNTTSRTFATTGNLPPAPCELTCPENIIQPIAFD